MAMIHADINIDDIDADDQWNCRGVIQPIDVAALAENIQAKGLIQPGVVMPHPHPENGFKWKLVAGFRRRMAMVVLKKKMFPCIIKEDLTEEDAMFMNLNENIQRSELNILQEAKTIAKIKFYNPKMGRTGCARKLGMSQGWVQIREMLLNLPEDIQQEVVAGLISQTQVRELNTIMRGQGRDDCYAAAKEMKKARIGGRKPRIKMKKNRNKVKQRDREAIFDMMADLSDSIPYTDGDERYLWPRLGAWAAGEISDNDLFESAKAFAEQEGHHWITPECDA